MTYFKYKVRVIGQNLGHYPAKLLKRFTFVQMSKRLESSISVKDHLKERGCKIYGGKAEKP